MFTAISPIKCESLVSTHGNDDYADDDADAYDIQDGNECEDSHKAYDTSGDWNGGETSALKSRRGKGKGNKVKRTLDPVIVEDAVTCSYMVVMVETDYQNEDADKLRYDCEPLPLRMKYQQMTFISVFLRRWCQVTAGIKMLNRMSKVTGGNDDVPMERAVMKAIRLTRMHYKPEPVPSIPNGSRNISMKFIMKIPEFLWCGTN